MEAIVERTTSWQYAHGAATLQLVRGEWDTACRLWNGQLQSSAWGQSATVLASYERMLKEEQHCWESHNRQGSTSAT